MNCISELETNHVVQDDADANDTTLRYNPTEVTQPGATLRDLLEERDWKPCDLAYRLGWPIAAVNELLASKMAITESVALEI